MKTNICRYLKLLPISLNQTVWWYVKNYHSGRPVKIRVRKGLQQPIIVSQWIDVQHICYWTDWTKTGRASCDNGMIMNDYRLHIAKGHRTFYIIRCFFDLKFISTPFTLQVSYSWLYIENTVCFAPVVCILPLISRSRGGGPVVSSRCPCPH